MTGSFRTINGSVQNGIARLKMDGSLDETFSFPTSLNADFADMVVLSDGKTVVAGRFGYQTSKSNGQIIRLNSDGQIDGSFIPISSEDYEYTHVAILPNQRILAAFTCAPASGCTTVGLQLFEGNGSPITEFGTVDLGEGVIVGIGAQANDAIIVMGFDLVFDGVEQTGFRFDDNGSWDSSFNPNIASSTPEKVSSFTILDDGTIGAVSGDRTTVRIFNSDGEVENTVFYPSSFSRIGKTDNSSFILVGNVVVEIQPDGSLGAAFTTKVDSDVLDFEVAGDDLVLVGNFDLFDTDTVAGIAKVLLGEDAPAADPTFVPALMSPGLVSSILVASDGGVVVGGDFDYVNGAFLPSLVKIKSNGDIDGDFNKPNTEADFPVTSLASLEGGDIIAGGVHVDDFGSPTQNGLVQYRANGDWQRNLDFPFEFDPGVIGDIAGTFDSTFYAIEDSSYAWRVYEVLESGIVSYLLGYIDVIKVNGLQTDNDGLVFIYGLGIELETFDPASIIRLRDLGDQDFTFGDNLPDDFEITEIAVLISGDIMVAGGTTVDEDSWEGDMYVLKSNGEIENSFEPEITRLGTSDFRIHNISVLPNGEIMVAGNFDSFDGFETESGIVILDENWDPTGDLLPTGENVKGSSISESSSASDMLYVAGQFNTSTGAVSLMRFDFTSSTTDVERLNSLQAFPNPAAGSSIEIATRQSKLGSSVVYTIVETSSGRLLEQGELLNSGLIRIDISDLVSGQYLVTLSDGRVSYVARFVKID